MKTQPVPPPTQLHLNIRRFVGDVLVADDGTLAQVLEIEPVDLTMADPDEAAFLRAQFGRFISSIRFPDAIQIVMATFPQNLAAYLGRMRGLSDERLRQAELLREADPPRARRERRLGERLSRWAAFIQYTLEQVRPIENRYLVVVFHCPPALSPGRRRSQAPGATDRAIEVLGRKLSHVEGELNHAGLKAHRLSATQVAELVYFFYHPVKSPLADQTPPRLRLGSSLLASGEGWAVGSDREES